MEELTNAEKLIVEEAEAEGAYSFKFADKEGPLDLLLYMIKKSKVEIEDVKLADITDQYLSIVKEAQNMNMEIASEFIVVASQLLEIKSKTLLPKDDEPEEEVVDEEWLLKMRLKEHELMKEMAENLKPLENTDRFYKAPEPSAGKFRFILKDMQLDMLLDAFVSVMNRVTQQEKKNETKEVEKEKFTVEQKISSIKDALLLNKKVGFKELFSPTASKNEIVTTFMALLEMLKLQEIKVQQDGLFNDITIVKREDEEDSESEEK